MRAKSVLVGLLAIAAMGAAVPAANAAKIQTAPGTSVAANAITFANAGSAAGSHTFAIGSVPVTCTSAQFKNTAIINNGTRSVSSQPTFSGCTIGGVTLVKVTCGTWTFSSPAPPPENHNSTTGATTGLSVSLAQGPPNADPDISVPTGSACHIAAPQTNPRCTIDIDIQTISSGITAQNVNSSDADAGDPTSNGVRIIGNVPTGIIKYQSKNCGFAGIPDTAPGSFATNATYKGSARFTGSGSTPRVWIVTG